MLIDANATSQPILTLLGDTQQSQIESLRLPQNNTTSTHLIYFKVITSGSIYIENWAEATTDSLQISDTDWIVWISIVELDRLNILWSWASIEVSLFVS